MTVLYWIAGSHLEALPYLDKIHEMNLLLPRNEKAREHNAADVSGIGWNLRSDSYEFQPDTVLFMAGSIGARRRSGDVPEEPGGPCRPKSVPRWRFPL